MALIQENRAIGKASAMIACKKIGVAYFVLINHTMFAAIVGESTSEELSPTR